MALKNVKAIYTSINVLFLPHLLFLRWEGGKIADISRLALIDIPGRKKFLIEVGHEVTVQLAAVLYIHSLGLH